MIKLIDRYIMTSILAMTLLIFFIFFVLLLLVGISGEMSQLGEGDYTLWQGIGYVFYTLPLNFYMMFPMIALLGSLLGLGTLASHSELTVMRTSGLSILRLSRAIFLVALIVIGIGMVVGEYFAPALTAQAEQNKFYWKHKGQVLSTEQGIWLRQNQAFIHIGTSYDRQRLSDITRYELNEDFQLARIRHADFAALQGKQWLMQNVVTSEVSFDKVTVGTEPTALWDMNVDLSDMDISPSQLNLVKLYKQAQLRDKNGINSRSFWLSFWTRVFQPVITLIMVFLAIPFAFGPLRSATAGLRLLTGVMLGLSFYIFNRFFGPFILAYHLPAILGPLVPMILFSGLMFFLMLRRQ
jgi:lipopolysaccharide export system permease protein